MPQGDNGGLNSTFMILYLNIFKLRGSVTKNLFNVFRTQVMSNMQDWWCINVEMKGSVEFLSFYVKSKFFKQAMQDSYVN